MKPSIVFAALALTACAGPQAAQPKSPSPKPALLAPPQDAQNPNFTLTFPRRYPTAAPAASAETARATPPSANPSGAAPGAEAADPEPLALENQWEYKFVYDRGAVTVGRASPQRFAKPVVTARRVGRYAMELWIGHELVDRVRFDFPLIGAEPAAPTRLHPLQEAPSLLPGAQVSRVVLVPASERATRALLRDRATGKTVELPWPPDQPLGPVTQPAPAVSASPASPPSVPPQKRP